MSYKNIIESVLKINKEVDGIRAVYDYEPMTPTTPCLYTILEAIPEMNQLPNQEEIVYHISMRLVLRYTDAEKAEQDLNKFVDEIIETYRSKVKLDGALSNGSAQLTGGRAGYIRVGIIAYRAVIWTLTVTERTAVIFSE